MILEAITWAVAASVLIIHAGVWALGVRRIRSNRSLPRSAPEPAPWPRAHVFVCLKGDLPEIRETVAALDAQDYRGEYRVTFVTEGDAPSDAAAAELLNVVRSTRRCDHAVAGRVLDSIVRCGQKNFNLLAGIRHADERWPDIELYAFCDGDLRVKSSWLREMARPIATGQSEATTSLHCAVAAERRILGALHGMAESTQSLASLAWRGATWGGSMAIRRSAFHGLGLPHVWSRTCVDDVTMSRALREARLQVTVVPQFLVSARSDIGSYRGFVRWLGRQFFFVKVYLPGSFRLVWARCATDVLALWLATFHVSHRLVRGEWAQGPETALAAVGAAATALASCHALRFLLPERPPLKAWLAATLLGPGAGVLACADATLRRKRLIWRDLTYDLARGGHVVTVTGNDPTLAGPQTPLAGKAAA